MENRTAKTVKSEMVLRAFDGITRMIFPPPQKKLNSMQDRISINSFYSHQNNKLIKYFDILIKYSLLLPQRRVFAMRRARGRGSGGGDGAGTREPAARFKLKYGGRRDIIKPIAYI
jgi:hypothetical protein